MPSSSEKNFLTTQPRILEEKKITQRMFVTYGERPSSTPTLHGSLNAILIGFLANFLDTMCQKSNDTHMSLSH